MARLNVRMVKDEDFLSFPDIADRSGYYLDVLTGDIFRNAGHFSDATRRILAERQPGDEGPLSRKPFLLISEDLNMTLREAKEEAARKYGVDLHSLGKMVHSME